MTSDDNTKRSLYDVIPRSVRLHLRRGCPTCFSPVSLLLQILQVLVEESLARSSACTNWNLFFWFSENYHNIWGSKPIIFSIYLKQMNIGKSELLWGSPGDSMVFDPYSGAAG